MAMNYRLGALGWSAGPSFQASGGVSNAGLYDQRLAIEWVAKYIHLFGGDPNQITVFGESAGGEWEFGQSNSPILTSDRWLYPASNHSLRRRAGCFIPASYSSVTRLHTRAQSGSPGKHD